MLLMWVSLPAMFLQQTRLCEDTNRWYDGFANPSGRCSQKTGLLFDIFFVVCFDVCFDYLMYVLINDLIYVLINDLMCVLIIDLMCVFD